MLHDQSIWNHTLLARIHVAKKKHLNAPTVVLLKLHSGVAMNVMARLFAMRAVSSMLKKKKKTRK